LGRYQIIHQMINLYIGFLGWDLTFRTLSQQEGLLKIPFRRLVLIKEFM